MTVPGQGEEGAARPVRVLQILEATTGGTRRHLYYLLSHLDREKFALSLAYSPLRDPHFSRDLEQFRRLGVTLHEVPMRREVSLWHDLVALVRILRIIRRGCYDVVHAHSSKAGFLGRIAARYHRVRAVVYSPHSFSFQYCAGSRAAGFYLLLERLAGRWHHRLFCVSEGERRVALEHSLTRPERIAVLPNAIAPDALRPTRTPSEMRIMLGLAEGVPIVGMVAHFRPQKGYAYFIDAIPQILLKCPQARFLIVGDGPLLDAAKRQIRDLGVDKSVILAGYQEHPPDFYQVMDLFVLSSLWEGLPYVVLEAMSFGLPVIASGVYGNDELVTHGLNGFLVQAGCSGEIASRVVSLLQDQPMRARFSEESRKTAASMSDIRRWAQRYGELYLQAGAARDL